MSTIPAMLQNQVWLLCDCCAFVAYAVVDGDNPRPSGKPRAGDRCPQCVQHGPNHQGRLIAVRAHLEDA